MDGNNDNNDEYSLFIYCISAFTDLNAINKLMYLSLIGGRGYLDVFVERKQLLTNLFLVLGHHQIAVNIFESCHNDRNIYN